MRDSPRRAAAKGEQAEPATVELEAPVPAPAAMQPRPPTQTQLRAMGVAAAAPPMAAPPMVARGTAAQRRVMAAKPRPMAATPRRWPRVWGAELVKAAMADGAVMQTL